MYPPLNSAWSFSSESPNFGSFESEGLTAKFLVSRCQYSCRRICPNRDTTRRSPHRPGLVSGTPHSSSDWRCLQSPPEWVDRGRGYPKYRFSSMSSGDSNLILPGSRHSAWQSWCVVCRHLSPRVRRPNLSAPPVDDDFRLCCCCCCCCGSSCSS